MFNPSETSRQMQALTWVLSEAAHPVASQYHHLTSDIKKTRPMVSLLRVQDCVELVLRYACVIQLAQRYAVLGENGAWETRILDGTNRPDGPAEWLPILIELTENARSKGWQETFPIFEWLFEETAARRAVDLFSDFCTSQQKLLPAAGISDSEPTEARAGRDVESGLFEQFVLLNRLLEHASFLKSWTLLHRSQGTTKAWMGRESPRDSRIRTPKRFEGQFILHWGKRKFLSLSPYISLLARPYTGERHPAMPWRDGVNRFQAWIQSPGQAARRLLDKAFSPAQFFRSKAMEWSGDTLALWESTTQLRNHVRSLDPMTQQDISTALDTICLALKEHSLTPAVSGLADTLRTRNLLPNEKSTENLIRYLVDQALKRSPVQIPDFFVSQFWKFFSELEKDPQAKGLMEINYDIFRSLLKIYEPLIVEGINLWKERRRLQEQKKQEFGEIWNRVLKDFQIFRRQVLALRHIKRFLDADPKDFSAQAQIVARMVGEFGPFFIKFAQVAATHSDFLPQEIAKELEKFQEEVPPMPADQMLRALQESFRQTPSDRYYGLDPARPIRSGSIASVYLAKRPLIDNGREYLIPVILKVAREDLEREFLIGEKVIELAILSTHYWAPHSKLSPFLQAWMDQIQQWAHGFNKELDFKKEASIQQSFSHLSHGSRIWTAPKILAATDRVLEMEYVQNAHSLKKYVQTLEDSSGSVRKGRYAVAQNLVLTVLLQAVQHHRIHGDLHPGNILVDGSGRLHLIDWGNFIELEEKIRPLLVYVQGVLLADADRIAGALVAISSDPAGNQKRIEEIRDTVTQTMIKRGMFPLASLKAIRNLVRDPGGDLWRRVQTIPHITSLTQSLGIVIESDYLQMSRSISALFGTYLSLFPHGKKMKSLLVLVLALTKFPYVYSRERISCRRAQLRDWASWNQGIR